MLNVNDATSNFIIISHTFLLHPSGCCLCTFPSGSPISSHFPKISRWTDCAKLSLDVNECLNVCVLDALH